MANLFEKAKKTSAKKKVENHEIVNLSIKKELLELSELNVKIAELEAEKAVLDSTVREAAKEAMISMYKTKKSFPGTLKIVDGEMSMLFLTSDRYKKIDEDRFNELAKEYSPKLVEESTKYSFNTAILKKHMKHISKLLMTSDQLSDEDKDNLLEGETSYTVRKGTIKELFLHTNDVEKIIEDIMPVFSIKSVQKNS